MGFDRKAAFDQELERVNTEYGTNLTVDGILEGWSGKDTWWSAKSILNGLLMGILLLVALIAIWAGLVTREPMSAKVVLLIIGSTAVASLVFPTRTEFRLIREWRRELKAIDEVNRRVNEAAEPYEQPDQ